MDTTPTSMRNRLGAFLEAVRPFQRTVYLVALAHTNDLGEAEFIAFQSLAKASRAWQGSRTRDELRLWLVEIVLAEANARVRKNEHALLDDPTEVPPNGLPLEGITAWRPIANGALRSAMMEAIRKLPRNNRVTLFLRDVLHFTTLETARLLGITQEVTRGRLAIGRIALCIELAKRVSSGCDLAGQAGFVTIC